MADKEGCFPVHFKAHFLLALSSFGLYQAEPTDRINNQPDLLSEQRVHAVSTGGPCPGRSREVAVGTRG